jgi:hypothetical protein
LRNSRKAVFDQHQLCAYLEAKAKAALGYDSWALRAVPRRAAATVLDGGAAARVVSC